MPRQARLDAPGTLHHVIARGIERRKIFLGEADYEDFVRRLGASVSVGGTRLLAWSLLPNHLHLLVQTGEVALSSVMRRILTGYAVSFNRRHRRHGHLFQNRYKSIVCEQEPYLLELVRYIHLNPLRAKGVAGDLAGLARYPYSGHGALLGTVERPWQAVGEVLGRFGAGQAEARRRYLEFIEKGVGQGRRPELVGGGLRRSCGGWLDARSGRARGEPPVYDERVLGSSSFVHDLLADAEWERRQALKTSQKRPSVADLTQRAALLAEVGLEELRGGSQRARVVEARAAVAQVAVRELGYAGAAVARYLRVVPSTVNRHAGGGELRPLANRLRETLEK
ncbi:MAG: transposase [Thermodesulfobacteriota bacterium]